MSESRKKMYRFSSGLLFLPTFLYSDREIFPPFSPFIPIFFSMCKIQTAGAAGWRDVFYGNLASETSSSGIGKEPFAHAYTCVCGEPAAIL